MQYTRTHTVSKRLAHVRKQCREKRVYFLPPRHANGIPVAVVLFSPRGLPQTRRREARKQQPGSQLFRKMIPRLRAELCIHAFLSSCASKVFANNIASRPSAKSSQAAGALAKMEMRRTGGGGGLLMVRRVSTVQKFAIAV